MRLTRRLNFNENFNFNLTSPLKSAKNNMPTFQAKHSLNFILLIFCLLIFSACSTASKSSGQISDDVQIKDSKFDTSRTYIGPVIDYKTEVHPTEKTTTAITHKIFATQNKKTGIVDAYLYVKLAWRDRYGWRHYNSASFDGGKIVSADPLSNKDGACAPGRVCNYEEIIAVRLKPEILQEVEKSKAGFSARINSQSGKSHVVDVPMNYIYGFFEGMSKKQP
ncbi:MAG: hypothetical protein CVU29_07360 [Betaproteobacteria bacterium HGW-Betaproteobacteria-22]|nr:MAG: hypothetical protein CVU29_07360 [Betaproteobacteria bacterium HGW-Betaproteobacteria-22]